MNPPAHVTVTVTDISLGVRENCNLCPIATAIKAAIGEPRAMVTVLGDQAEIFIPRTGEGTLIATLPAEAQTFIHNFDAGHPVVPFTVDLTWREATY